MTADITFLHTLRFHTFTVVILFGCTYNRLHTVYLVVALTTFAVLPVLVLDYPGYISTVTVYVPTVYRDALRFPVPVGLVYVRLPVGYLNGLRFPFTAFTVV